MSVIAGATGGAQALIKGIVHFWMNFL